MDLRRELEAALDHTKQCRTPVTDAVDTLLVHLHLEKTIETCYILLFPTAECFGLQSLYRG